MHETIITAQGIGKEFVSPSGARFQALDAIDMEISANEFVCIVGPSGCGKSTLLRIMAGLDKASTGRALYRDRPIDAPGRDIGMVFQEYSLFPWLTVAQNVALGPDLAGRPKDECLGLARKYLEIVGMGASADAHPHELSGGMRQRVAIARALANDPDVLLMDEPFGALDAHTRILLQRELLALWEKNRKTIVFVTHGVDEAVYLADRIIVMSAHPGRIKDIIQVDLPRPRSRSMPRFGELCDQILQELEAAPAQA